MSGWINSEFLIFLIPYLFRSSIKELRTIQPDVSKSTILKRKKDLLFSETSFKNLIDDKDHQSLTTMCISSNIASILIEEAREKNIILGKGYGPWKGSTFRIANFPSIKNESFEALVDFLGSYN